MRRNRRKIHSSLIFKRKINQVAGCQPRVERSAVSIPSNIAEGQQRKSNKEFANFLSFARGSLAELETQLLICVRLGYLKDESIEKLMNFCKEIGKMINALMSKTEAK
ncbi:MAG: four helix bundle protein [Eubacterium sp.]|nr:four helix bundle protein [Eubacterium sp.]